ncbi:MAG: 16S rRNA (uracil(1498)-N(3))-methyltransferase [Burkholderiaceae bacterium]
MLPRLYLPDALAGADELALDAGLAHYLGQVLRLRPGAEVECFDGRGGRVRARVGRIERRQANLIDLRRTEPAPRPTPRTTLVQAGATGDKTDWVIEKATEAGVGNIVLFNGERGTAKIPRDRLERKLEHWQRVAAAACAQCGRDWLPPVSFVDSLPVAVAALDGPCLIATPDAPATLTAWARAQPKAPASVGLIIGPESGLSATELDAASAAGAARVSLGPRIWRTETAGLAGLVILHALLGDLQ